MLDVDFHAALQFAGSCWERFIESFYTAIGVKTFMPFSISNYRRLWQL